MFFVCLFSINQHHITKIYLSSRYTYSKSKHIKDESAILCLFGRYRTTEKPGLSGATTNAQDTNGRCCTAVDCISAKSKYMFMKATERQEAFRITSETLHGEKHTAQ